MPKKIIGFSKLSREEKIDWLSEKIFDDSNQVRSILDNYLNSNKDIQAIHDSFSENSISNFYLPYSCLLYTSPSPRDRTRSRMPSSA